jgi:MEMO1 family protein
MIMESVLSGSFYTADPIVLKEQINNFMQQVSMGKKYMQPLGIISPHAGYIYSGQCAAYGFNAIRSKDFDLAVIIAPCHRYIGFEYSVGKFEAFRTPLGLINVDLEAADHLLKVDKFQFLPQAYSNENSLETQIPFLQVIKSKVKILPILIGNQSSDNSKYLAETLFKQFGENLDRVVFIISSDLSHYHSADTAAEMDGKIEKCIAEKDVESLVLNIENRNSEACGFGAILTLLYLSKMTGYDKVDNLNYSHSGQINRDNSQVVGYISSIIYKGK